VGWGKSEIPISKSETNAIRRGMQANSKGGMTRKVGRMGKIGNFAFRTRENAGVREKGKR